MNLKATQALKKAKRRARKKAQVKLEAKLKRLPDYCSGCGLPMPAGQTFKHNYCY